MERDRRERKTPLPLIEKSRCLVPLTPLKEESLKEESLKEENHVFG